VSRRAANGCAVCGRPVAPRPDNKGWPFCSPRCRQVDLGRWLNEDYVISRELDESERGTSAPRSPGDAEDD
jgi:endogenous inhibitor of DNA gyrase (YacG/DUF329 family)